MWQVVKEHPRSFAYAVLAHLVLIIMLVINLDWSPKPTPAGAPTAPVQAVVIDESKVSAEVERLKTEEQRKEQAAAERLRELEQKTKQAEAARVKEQKRLEELKQKQAVEEKRLKQQETQRKLEQKKLETEKKRITEQKKLEQKKLEQKQAEQKQQAEEKRLAEAESKRKMAAEAEAKAKAEAEAKRKADAEAKAKAAAEAQRKAAEQALQAQIAAEDAARNQSIISQYVGIIGDRVQRNWIQPPSSRAGLSCVVQVQLMPGGDVISVQIVQGSGDAAFDRSVEAAVFRAAPLPLPPDPALFESFRTLQFRFTPK